MSPINLNLHRARLLGQYKPAEYRAILRVAQLNQHNHMVHHCRQQAEQRKVQLVMPLRHGKGRR